MQCDEVQRGDSCKVKQTTQHCSSNHTEKNLLTDSPLRLIISVGWKLRVLRFEGVDCGPTRRWRMLIMASCWGKRG